MTSSRLIHKNLNKARYFKARKKERKRRREGGKEGRKKRKEGRKGRKERRERNRENVMTQFHGERFYLLLFFGLDIHSFIYSEILSTYYILGMLSGVGYIVVNKPACPLLS